jgi:hypothetical protein
MKLKRITGFDYFLVCLSECLRGTRVLYNKYGGKENVEEIAQTKFGIIKRRMDAGYYCEEDK